MWNRINNDFCFCFYFSYTRWNVLLINKGPDERMIKDNSRSKIKDHSWEKSSSQTFRIKVGSKYKMDELKIPRVLDCDP